MDKGRGPNASNKVERERERERDGQRPAEWFRDWGLRVLLHSCTSPRSLAGFRVYAVWRVVVLVVGLAGCVGFI